MLQPTAALLVVLDNGKRDARYGRPPVLSALVFQEDRRLHLLQHAFASIGDLVAIAIILDVISQFLIFLEFHRLAALLVGPAVIAVTYSLSGALTNRIVHGRAQQGADGRPG